MNFRNMAALALGFGYPLSPLTRAEQHLIIFISSGEEWRSWHCSAVLAQRPSCMARHSWPLAFAAMASVETPIASSWLHFELRLPVSLRSMRRAAKNMSLDVGISSEARSGRAKARLDLADDMGPRKRAFVRPFVRGFSSWRNVSLTQLTRSFAFGATAWLWAGCMHVPTDVVCGVIL